MTQIVEDRHSQLEADSEQHPKEPKAQSARTAALAVIVLATVIAGVLIVRSRADGKPAAGPAVGTGAAVSVVMRCGGTEQGCIGATTLADGSQWAWITNVHEAVPEPWRDREISGEIRIESEWGPSTFTAAGQTIAVQGGKATPGHSFFG
jgi:hypothetical protein